MISGLNRTAFDLAVYASQGWSPTHHARLASGCWSGSTGRDWLPAGFHLKGFKLPTILLSRAFLARGQGRFSVFQPRMDAHRKPQADSEGDIPNSCRKQGKRGNILALQPLHRTARKRSAGELLRYRSGDAALAIARMPTRITSGPDGQDGGY